MALVEPKSDPLKVKVERVLVSQQEAVVLLATENGDFKGKVLPVFVDLGQAMNIQVGLEGKMIGRPLTHDLFTIILNEMSAIVDRVVIEDIAQNTFFATLHLELDRGGKREKAQFDARPSDCIALAVRASAPIMVRRKVLESAAVERDKIMGERPGAGPFELPEEGEEEREEPEDKKPKDAPRKGPDKIDPGELERP